MIEDLRGIYGRSQDFHSYDEDQATSEEKVKKSFRKQLLLIASSKQDEIEKIDVMRLLKSFQFSFKIHLKAYIGLSNFS